MRIAAFAAVVTLSLSACRSADLSGFERYQATSPLALTQGEAPAGAEPISLVWVQSSGFYLFGLLTIVRADLETTLDLLVREARKISADGVSNIKIDYVPAAIFEFKPWPFPWFATVGMSGMAYRKK